MFGLVLSALVAGPLLGYSTATLVAVLHDTPVGRIDTQAPPFPGLAGYTLVMTCGILVISLGGVWDLVRARREAPSAAEPWIRPTAAVRLRDAVPVWAIWSARVLAVGPALVAAAACAAQGRSGPALGFVALAPLCCSAAWSMERLQRWMLNTERLAGEQGLLPQQTAFEDAFRTATSLPVVMLAPCVCVLAGALYIHLAGRGIWYQGLMLAWAVTILPIVAMNGLLHTVWLKRHYRRGVHRAGASASGAS